MAEPADPILPLFSIPVETGFEPRCGLNRTSLAADPAIRTH